MGKEPKSVRLENITKLYQDPKDKNKSFKAVDNISLTIKSGEFVTLLGPSGCGKTTTLRMIAGFEEPDSGKLFLGDTVINQLPPNKRDTAMVFQSYALFPQYNVFDNIAYGLKIQKLSKEEINLRVNKMLDLMELSGLGGRQTNQLSGGQQQRVALARALIVQPSVLLFDEPLSNLDAKLRVSMRTEIRNLQKKTGITAIYVTHDQSEAMSLSDSIIIMNKGIVEQMGTPEDIYYHPKSQFVADFIGEANFLDGIVKKASTQGATVEVAGVTLEALSAVTHNPGDACKLVLRPEAASISDSGLLPCEVLSSTFMGAYQDYAIKVQDTFVKITEYNPVCKKIFHAGEKAFLDFAPDSIHIL